MTKREHKKTGHVKRVMAVVLTMVLVMGMCPISADAAESTKWIPLGNGRHQLEGTEVIAEIAPGTVHITGTGALPDFDYWELDKRPWASCECTNVIIDGTITAIGAYAFYDLPKLKYIAISSKTFIKDYTAFYKNAQNPVFRIGGSEVTTEMFGTVPYTSMDSIRAFAQSGWGGSYVLDDGASAKAFQESTNPTIPHVFIATDAKAPWLDLNLNGNGNVYTGIARLAPSSAKANLMVTGMKKYQGRACYQVFGAMIGDYSFAGTYDIAVSLNDAKKTKVTTTNTPNQYVLDIPKEFQKAGRSFRLLSIGKDKLYTYDDLDTAGNTITYETDYPSAAFALVYKDVQ